MAISKKAAIEIASLINTLEVSCMFIQTALREIESGDEKTKEQARESLRIWGDARSEASCFLQDKYGITLATIDLDRQTVNARRAETERASRELRELRHAY